MQTMHSNMWGVRLSHECQRLLLGADTDEDDLSAAVSDAMPFDAAAAKAVLLPLVCDRKGQPCHAAAKGRA
eukprot:2337137-Prymnesium_polylepis.2